MKKIFTILCASSALLTIFVIILLANHNFYIRHCTCSFHPSLLDIKYNNDLWQFFETKNARYYLYSAFLDRRKLVEKPLVRILGMIDNPSGRDENIYCQLWYKGRNQPIFQRIGQFNRIWIEKWGKHEEGVLNPYLISCLNTLNEAPISVSLVERPCDNSTNNLKVIWDNNEIEKKKIAVCVKGLSFPNEDLTVRLAEWIELNLILGADKIFFYDLHIHPSTEKLLNYYVSRKNVIITPLTLAGNTPNTPFLQNLYISQKIEEKRFQEVIPYNDCFYKNMYKYHYILIQDIDEIIFPKVGNWNDMISMLENIYGGNDSFMARNVYFLERFGNNVNKKAPKYMYILQHLYRSKSYTKEGHYMKSFHNTESVLSVHNHLSVECLGKEYCSSVYIDENIVHLQHYRRTCVEDVDCNMFSDPVLDDRVLRYQNELVKRVKKVLDDINYTVK